MKRYILPIAALFFAAVFAVSEAAARTIELPEGHELDWDKIVAASRGIDGFWFIPDGESLDVAGVRFTCVATSGRHGCGLRIQRDLTTNIGPTDVLIARLASDPAPRGKIPKVNKSAQSKSPLMIPVKLPYDHRLYPAELEGKGNKKVRRYKIAEGAHLDIGRVRFTCETGASDSCTVDIFKKAGTVHAHAWKSVVTADYAPHPQSNNGWIPADLLNEVPAGAGGHDRMTTLLTSANVDAATTAKTARAIRKAIRAGTSSYSYETEWIETPKRLADRQYTSGRSLVTVANYFYMGGDWWSKATGDPALSASGHAEDDGSNWLPHLRAGKYDNRGDFRGVIFRGVEMSGTTGLRGTGSPIHVNLWRVVDGRGIPNKLSDDANLSYLSFGYWMQEDMPGTMADETAVGVFAEGNSPYRRGDELRGLAGTASYKGPAAGLYSRTAKGGTMTESFRGKVTLTADFGTADDLGTLSGQVHDIVRRDGQSLGTIDLLKAGIQSYQGRSQKYGPHSPMVEGAISRGGKSVAGSWDAVFYGAADFQQPVIEPVAVSGTFRAKDGKEEFAGAFGAFHEDHLNERP